MKKMLVAVLVAVLGFAGSAYAQFSAGTTTLGGNFSFSKSLAEYPGYYDTEEVILKRMSIGPRIGTFVSPDFEAGLQVSYVKNVIESKSSSRISTSSEDMFMLAPYGRQYFTLNEWAGFYIQGSAAFGWGRVGVKDLSRSMTRTRVFVATLAPGVTIRAGKHLGIDFQANLLEYISSTAGLKGDYQKTRSNPTGSISFGPDFTKVALGISFYL
jgi:hypothetical protein